MFVWEDGYKIGQEEMDAEHLILFALLNQLDVNINADRAGDCLDDVLNALGSYIDYHFAHEEALMQSWNYPGLETHSAMHKEFIKELAGLRAQVKGADALKAALKVRGFVLDWLLGHILETDVDYAAFMAVTTPTE
ncbi:MAG: hemerythrin family protein [Rhodospirillaceae bacterium]|nr:hemerythrin family protein [Rhodospirillales bacterium]